MVVVKGEDHHLRCNIQLLRKNPNARLGAKPKKADAIRRHRFFRTIDWDALLRREISPPIVPIVVSTFPLPYYRLLTCLIVQTDPEAAEVILKKLLWINCTH